MGFWDAIIGGAFDTANSYKNRKAQEKENERQREHARQQQEDAQAFNAEQAQLDRDFQSSEAQVNRDFQSKMAEDAYDRQVEFYEQYQSIGAQMQQYKDAGLNPALLAGGVSPAASAPSSASPSGSTPSGSSASSVASVAGASSLPGVIGFAEKVLDLQSMKEGINAVKADIALKREQVETEKFNRHWGAIMNENTLAVSAQQIENLKKDIEVKDNQIDIGNSTIEVNASQAELNAVVAAFKRMEKQQMEELLPYVKQLHSARTQEAYNDAALKLAQVALVNEQASRTDTGEKLDIAGQVVSGVAETVTTGVLIADMVGEVFGVEDMGQRWSRNREIHRDSKGRITSVTETGSGDGKKVTKKRRRKR